MPVTLEFVTLSLDVVSKSGTLSECVVTFILGQISLRCLEVAQDFKGLGEGVGFVGFQN